MYTYKGHYQLTEVVVLAEDPHLEEEAVQSSVEMDCCALVLKVAKST